MGALILAIDSARAAVADRRRDVLHEKIASEDEAPESTLKMGAIARLAAE